MRVFFCQCKTRASGSLPFHSDFSRTPASVTRFRIALRLKSCSVRASYRGSYGLPSTAMIRPRPSAAQAFVHSLRMLVVSNTRPCFGSILSSIKTRQGNLARLFVLCLVVLDPDEFALQVDLRPFDQLSFAGSSTAKVQERDVGFEIRRELRKQFLELRQFQEPASGGGFLQ